MLVMRVEESEFVGETRRIDEVSIVINAVREVSLMPLSMATCSQIISLNQSVDRIHVIFHLRKHDKHIDGYWSS